MESSYNKICKRITGIQVSGIPNHLYYLPESKAYTPQGHQFSETDIVDVLQQRNFEEEFEYIMKGSNSQLQEYFRYIGSSQQMSHPPSDWDNVKKLFMEIIIIDAAER